MPIELPIALGAAQLWGTMANNASQRDQQRQQGLMRAAEIRSSPWTKMGPETKVDFAPSQGSALAQGLVGGTANALALSQKSADAEAQQKLQEAMLANQMAQTNMWSKMAAPTLMSSSPAANYWGSKIQPLSE